MIALLADDFTSALDCAAPFASKGLSARVLFDANSASDTAVVSIDLNSRFMPGQDAERRFHEAARRVTDASVIFKTVDSTLRGNIGAEIRGALRGSARRHAVIAPAFPAAGRITRDGHQFVDGVPVDRTVYANDPRTPILSGKIAHHLDGCDPATFSIHDAEMDGDLDRLVAQIKPSSPVLWAGSPGLAAAIARAVTVPSTAPGVSHRGATRIIVAIGSLQPGNAGQLDLLNGTGAAFLELAEVRSDADIAAAGAALSRAFTETSVVCLTTPRRLPGRGASYSSRYADDLAVVIKTAKCFDGLVVTGGDTARRLADSLEATALDLIGEVEPGVPFGLLETRAGKFPFAAKAGGFGKADTLANCVTRLMRSSNA